MRSRLSFTAIILVLLAAAACSRAAEITAPAESAHRMDADAAGDTTRRGPGLVGGGN